MKILFVSEYIPYFPCYDGFRLIPYNLLKGLSKSHEIHLVTFINSEDENKHVPQLRKYCSSVETVMFKHDKSALSSLRSLFSRYSWKEDMYIKIVDMIKKYSIELIHVEGAYMGQYVHGIKNLPKIIVPHDSPSGRAFELFNGGRGFGEKAKYYLQWKKSIQYEKSIYKEFDHCVVVSPQDKAIIQKNVPDLNISVVTNGVDADYYEYKRVKSDGKSIIFTGNMAYPPNVDAVLYFYSDIFPLIRQNVNDIKFYVVGADPVDEILNLRKDGSVVVTGKVDDIRQYVYGSSVYVSPMRFGTGIKNKILEAMSMGIPIVATNKSMAGIDAFSEKELSVADNEIDFAEKVIELLRDDKKCSYLADSARRLIETQYSWGQKAKLFDKIYREVAINQGGAM